MNDREQLSHDATWLIVVAADEPRLLQELKQRFSCSTLVHVIGDRRGEGTPLGLTVASPHDRRNLGSAQEHDRSSYGFFVVHRPECPPAPEA